MQPNSPADVAGLKSNTDYVIGADSVLHEVWHLINVLLGCYFIFESRLCSSAVRAFAHGAMGRRIDHSWGGPIELFLVTASAPQLV